MSQDQRTVGGEPQECPPCSVCGAATAFKRGRYSSRFECVADSGHWMPVVPAPVRSDEQARAMA